MDKNIAMEYGIGPEKGMDEEDKIETPDKSKHLPTFSSLQLNSPSSSDTNL